MRPLRDPLYLAWRYLCSAPGRSLVLILGTTVAIFLPLFTFKGAQQVERSLLSRANESPILIGQKGNEFDLTMNALYFRGQVNEPIPFGSQRKIRDYGLAIPLYVNHSAAGAPIVGTSLEYFEQRGLELVAGRRPALLGEVVAGAEVARSFRLSVGDRIRSDAANLYNLAGAYPLLLDVVGILESTGNADDQAFFADVKTAWALDGRLHGHDEVTRDLSLDSDVGGDGDEDEGGDEDDNLEATAALFLFAEIDERNRASFHMHGGTEEAPLSSILLLPRDQKAHDQVLGDFALDEEHQAVRPVTVVRTILDIVLRVRAGLTVYFVTVAVSTVAFFALITVLTLRLRRREIELMARIGCGRGTLATIVGAEILLVLTTAVVLSGVATWLGLALIDRFL